MEARDNHQLSSQPIVAESEASLFAFLYGLSETDLSITPLQLINAQKVLTVLKPDFSESASVELLKKHLAPLFTFSPDGQELFYRQFDRWWKAQQNPAGEGGHEIKSGETEKKHEKSSSATKGKERVTKIKRWIGTAALIILMILATAWFFYDTSTVSKINQKKLSGAVRNLETTEAVAEAIVQIENQTARTSVDGSFSLNFEVSEAAFASGRTINLLVDHQQYESAVIPLDLQSSAPLDVLLKPKIAVSGVTVPQSVPDLVPNELYKRIYEWLLFSVAGLPFIIFGFWSLSRFWRRRQLEKWRQENRPNLHRLTVEHSEEQLYRQTDFLKLTREMRRYRHIASNALEPIRTVEETIRAGNFFTPVYAVRRVSPEYLILIDRHGYVDQNARLIDEIVRRLKKQGVFVERYFFEGDPRICWRETDNHRFFDLEKFAAQYPEDRLLIFSDGRSLIEPFTNRPRRDLLKLLATWEVRFLLVTNAVDHFHEWILPQFGLPVLRSHGADLKNLVDLLDPEQSWRKKRPKKNARRRHYSYPPILKRSADRWWTRDALPEPEVYKTGWENPIKSDPAEDLRFQLRLYLGAQGYELLCACAVYPEMLWDLSFYLSHHLVESERREETLENLVCLPWFRTGAMPVWLRNRLLESLSQEREAAIRNLIEQLLVSYLQNPQRGFQLEIAPEPPPKTLFSKLRKRFQNWKRKKLLYDLIKVEPPESPLRDFVFLSFLSKNRLAVALPRRLQESLRQSMRTAQNWRRRIYTRLAQITERVAAVLKVIYRYNTPLIGISQMQAVTGAGLLSIIMVSVLMVWTAGAFALVKSIPQMISENLPEPILELEPPFAVPLTFPSVTPTPLPTVPSNTTPSPTVQTTITPPRDFKSDERRTPTPTPVIDANITDIVVPPEKIVGASGPSPNFGNINSNRQNPNQIDKNTSSNSPTPVEPGPTSSPTPNPTPVEYQITIALKDEETNEPITSGNLAWWERSRGDESDIPIFKKELTGESQTTVQLPADYFVVLATSSGYVSRTVPVEVSGTTTVVIKLRKDSTPTPADLDSTIGCPTGLTLRPSSVSMTTDEEADLEVIIELNADKASFQWTTSGGRIIGSNENKVKIGGFSSAGQYTVSVVVDDGSQFCFPRTLTATISVSESPKETQLIDEFGKATNAQLGFRLDNFYSKLLSAPTTIGYIYISGPRDEIKARESAIYSYFDSKNYDSKRIQIKRDDKKATIFTRFFVVPAGKPFPPDNSDSKAN